MDLISRRHPRQEQEEEQEVRVESGLRREIEMQEYEEDDGYSEECSEEERGRGGRLSNENTPLRSLHH